MTKCEICEEKLEPLEEGFGVCQTCRHKLGIVPLPPVTRPPVPCTRCNSLQFLRVVPRETSSTGGEYGSEYTAPQFLTYPPRGAVGIFTSYAKPLDIKAGYGLVELFVCRKCGFIEHYCPTVNDVPVHKHLNTEVVDYEATKGGPFR